MSPLEIASAIFIALVVLIIVGTGLYGMFGPQPQHKPMSYDDEVKWLMETHGMAKEQAEEIANL